MKKSNITDTASIANSLKKGDVVSIKMVDGETVKNSVWRVGRKAGEAKAIYLEDHVRRAVSKIDSITIVSTSDVAPKRGRKAASTDGAESTPKADRRGRQSKSEMTSGDMDPAAVMDDKMLAVALASYGSIRDAFSRANAIVVQTIESRIGAIDGLSAKDRRAFIAELKRGFRATEGILRDAMKAVPTSERQVQSILRDAVGSAAKASDEKSKPVAEDKAPKSKRTAAKKAATKKSAGDKKPARRKVVAAN